MPKSKRQRVVALTKTKKKGREWKQGLVEKVRDAAAKHSSCYLFKTYNMRTEPFKEFREELGDRARIVMGSNKVLQVALGRDEADEVQPNIHLLSERIKGNVGLLFTDMGREEVDAAVNGFSHEGFARAGGVALHDFKLPEGPLLGPDGALQHTMEPQLRKYGMPTKLNKGVVELITDFTVCKEGQVLDANQASILRVFGIRMAELRLKLLAVWHGDDVEELDAGSDDSDEDGEGGDGDDDIEITEVDA